MQQQKILYLNIFGATNDAFEFHNFSFFLFIFQFKNHFFCCFVRFRFLFVGNFDDRIFFALFSDSQNSDAPPNCCTFFVIKFFLFLFDANFTAQLKCHQNNQSKGFWCSVSSVCWGESFGVCVWLLSGRVQMSVCKIRLCDGDDFHRTIL